MTNHNEQHHKSILSIIGERQKKRQLEKLVKLMAKGLYDTNQLCKYYHDRGISNTDIGETITSFTSKYKGTENNYFEALKEHFYRKFILKR